MAYTPLVWPSPSPLVSHICQDLVVVALPLLGTCARGIGILALIVIVAGDSSLGTCARGGILS
eukprot:1595866-Amphidinium_carterae.1